MRVLPFLLLSVAFVSVASAQEGLFVREHNITYSLGVDRFFVEEKMLFEKPGDPFTFEGDLYFIRGDAEDVEVAGYPYKVSKISPRKIILEFMISTGQKKKVSLKYRRSDLITEKDGVFIYRGLALGDYPWTVNTARIEFIAPEGYQFGRYSPNTGYLMEGDRDSIIFTLSLLDNASAIFSGFPVEIEYADYKSLTRREVELSEMQIATAEFEVGLGNITLEKLASEGGNASLYQSAYSLALAALKDASKNYRNALSYKKNGRYYEAYLSARAAGRLAKLAIDEARKLRAAEAKLSASKDRAMMEAQPQQPVKAPTEEKQSAEQDRYPYIPFFLLASLLIMVMLILVFRRPEKEDTERPRIDRLSLKRRQVHGFEKEIERIKKRKNLASQIRELMRQRKSLEEDLEKARKSLAAEKIAEKEYTLRRNNLLRDIGKLDTEMGRLEAELERIKKEGND